MLPQNVDSSQQSLGSVSPRPMTPIQQSAYLAALASMQRREAATAAATTSTVVGNQSANGATTPATAVTASTPGSEVPATSPILSTEVRAIADTIADDVILAHLELLTNVLANRHNVRPTEPNITTTSLASNDNLTIASHEQPTTQVLHNINSANIQGTTPVTIRRHISHLSDPCNRPISNTTHNALPSSNNTLLTAHPIPLPPGIQASEDVVMTPAQQHQQVPTPPAWTAPTVPAISIQEKTDGRLNAMAFNLANVGSQVQTLQAQNNHLLTEVRGVGHMASEKLNQIIEVSEPGFTGKPVAHAKFLHKPAVLTGNTKHDSTYIKDHEIWYDKVIHFLQLTGATSALDIEFFLQGSALVWFNSLTRNYKSLNKTLDSQALRNEFIRAFGNPQRKHEAMEARERLNNREAVHTPGTTVAEYVQKLQIIMLDAPDMSETDKIYWFFRYLQPGLAKLASTDQHNQRHQTLASAIDAAYAAEHRMAIAKNSQATLAIIDKNVSLEKGDAKAPQIEQIADSTSEEDSDSHIAYVKRQPQAKFGKNTSRPQKYHTRTAVRKTQVLREMAATRKRHRDTSRERNDPDGPSTSGRQTPPLPPLNAQGREAITGGLCGYCAMNGEFLRWKKCKRHNKRA